MKNFNIFVKEKVNYPITQINLMLDKMTPRFKLKIFNLTEEKSDIHKALFELSNNPEKFDKIWKEFQNNLYFSHQNQP